MCSFTILQFLHYTDNRVTRTVVDKLWLGYKIYNLSCKSYGSKNHNPVVNPFCKLYNPILEFTTKLVEFMTREGGGEFSVCFKWISGGPVHPRGAVR